MKGVANRAIGAALCALAAGIAVAAVPAPAPGPDKVKAGVDAWEAGNYAKAVATWRPLAEAGDADAQFNLAQAYRLGRGGPIDMKAAESWYQKAATQGHNQAQANYGLLLFQNGQRKEALPFLEKAADKGDPRAQYVVGTALFNGDQLPKDWVRAYALMTRAAAAGLPPAATSLTEMDRYIPLDQRQQGTAMARDLERGAQLAQTSAPARAPSIRPVELPPSEPRPMGRPVTKPMVNTPPPAPVVPPVPAHTMASPPPPPVPVAAPARVAAPPPRPAPVTVPASSAGGKWRVQLGAFSTEAAARNQWGTLKGRVGSFGGLQPFFVQAGAVYRLQAGPFASKGDADRACGNAKGAGVACFAAAAP